ncbi:2'-5' RNA ligase family protein [Bacillus sp. AGMB 02131]|uniref:Putative phosphoesterase IEO70_16225 n=1 Tax=Peribacillus faecalis TaxID=2772559 RepID=A0A927CYA0_9BACI|nr:YjcG family protein [Peribacillus faecalis]MBD3109888.1 2'-5' RNA ligase family protein [Peribacillus faecalis]
MKYGVVIFPSKKLQDIVNSYRKRYDPNYSLIPPHITIKYTFESTEEEIAKVAKYLEEVAADTNPFTLRVLKVSTFQPVNNVIYLKVEPTSELVSLQQKLQNDLMGSDEFSFVPHITLGQKLTDAEHSDVFGQVSMLDLRHEETVDRFHLLYQLENGSWTVYETFRLGKEA